MAEFNHDFQINFKDLAIAEVHLDYIARETQAAVDASVEDIGKMKIEINSIKQPTMILLSEVDNFADNAKKEFNRIKTVLADKKAELLKTEEDFSAYDEALKEARDIANQDLATATKAYQKANNPLA